MTAVVLGLDIGGANVKAADGVGWARSIPFELWRQPQRLTEPLAELARDRPAATVAVTMTGELCDCFRTKADGVNQILDAVAAIFTQRRIAVWSTTGRWLTPTEARNDPWQAAASNFVALAHAVAADGIPDGLLIDMGSTTTDLTLRRAGQPCIVGHSDPDRLASGELLYQGVARTPVFALVPTVVVQGRRHRTMAEWFTTMKDVYCLLGDVAEDPHDLATADGRPRTKPHARERISRLIGSDVDRLPMEEALSIARQAKARQVQQLQQAIEALLDHHGSVGAGTVVLAGEGEFLVRVAVADLPRLRDWSIVPLSGQWGQQASIAGCAAAVARLWRQEATD